MVTIFSIMETLLHALGCEQDWEEALCPEQRIPISTIHCSRTACQEGCFPSWSCLKPSRWGWVKTDGKPHWTTLPEPSKICYVLASAMNWPLWIGLSLLQGCCSCCKCKKAALLCTALPVKTFHKVV